MVYTTGNEIAQWFRNTDIESEEITESVGVHHGLVFIFLLFITGLKALPRVNYLPCELFYVDYLTLNPDSSEIVKKFMQREYMNVDA